MAQLIKLQDYISRYEWDTYRYPTQFIRMKKDNWDRLYRIWENPALLDEETEMEKPPADNTPEVNTRITRFKERFRRKRAEQPEDDSAAKPDLYRDLPETEDGLKRYFLDKLFHQQLKWATSTISETSRIDERFPEDPLLKYLLQRFPDTYLLLYYPVFSIKKAPLETDIILISPVGIEIVSFLEKGEGVRVMAGDERTWTLEKDGDTERMLSPLIGLRRTEKVITSILAKHEIEFPIKKTVLSRTNSILYATEPYHTKIVDRHIYDDWFSANRALRSPLKSEQLKAAKALLQHTSTTSVKRMDWEGKDGTDETGEAEGNQ